MRILSDLQDLLLRQSREAEHADLIRDMLPAALLPVQLLQFPPQRFAHVDDAAGHGAQVGFPLLEELGVVEDEAGDAGAVGGRVADLAALEDGELGCYAADCVLGVRAGAGDEVEGAGSFAVETEVFGEGLGDAELEALLDEVADGPGVVFQIARGETLVCTVEEGEVVFAADDLGDFGPLVMSGVNAGWVMGTSMEEDDAAFGSFLNGG